MAAGLQDAGPGGDKLHGKLVFCYKKRRKNIVFLAKKYYNIPTTLLRKK